MTAAYGNTGLFRQEIRGLRPYQRRENDPNLRARVSVAKILITIAVVIYLFGQAVRWVETKEVIIPLEPGKFRWLQFLRRLDYRLGVPWRTGLYLSPAIAQTAIAGIIDRLLGWAVPIPQAAG